MKKFIIASGVAVLAFASIAGAQGISFDANLTVGSTGADVVTLQTFLLGKGYVIPALSSGAASKGYFGSQTKEAVMKFQAANGVPNTGFVGPLTRAALNSGGLTVGGTTPASCPAGLVCTPIATTVACPAGFVCTPVGSPVGGTVGGATGITTPGVEGTLSATQSNSGIASTVYEGESMVSILGAKLEAKNSDISVQRVKIDLGDSTRVYNKIYTMIYVTDGSNVLASSALNSSTVYKESSRYYINVSGFNYLVPKNSSKNIVIKASLMSSIDTSDRNAQSLSPVRFALNGIRGVDGAGIDQFSGDTTITRTLTVSSSLIESASLTLSTNTGSPLSQSVVASDGSQNNELDKLTVLTFDIKADKDNVMITDLVATIAATGAGTASTTYLYEGSNEIDSASLSSNTATFSNIDYTIPKGTTKTFALKVDIRGAVTAASTFVAQVTNAGISAENSQGDTVSNKSGSATSGTFSVVNAGPTIALTGAPSISKNTVTNSDISTTTASVTFNLSVKALGDALVFGTQAASSTFTFGIYENNVLVALAVASSTTFSTPDNANINNLSAGQAFSIPEDQTVLVPVTFTFNSRQVTGALLSTTNQYRVGLESVKWSTGTAPTSVQTTSFMAGQNAWRSGTVLP